MTCHLNQEQNFISKYKFMNVKMLSAKSWPFGFGLNGLKYSTIVWLHVPRDMYPLLLVIILI